MLDNRWLGIYEGFSIIQRAIRGTAYSLGIIIGGCFLSFTAARIVSINRYQISSRELSDYLLLVVLDGLFISLLLLLLYGLVRYLRAGDRMFKNKGEKT